MKGSDIKKLSLALFCLYIAAVAALCFMKPDDMPQVEKDFFGIPLDKVAHFLMFTPFTILSGMTFIHKERSLWKGLTVIVILYVVGAGAAYGTEVLQAQTGYRAYEMGDFFADLSGLSFGTVVSAVYLAATKRKETR